MHRVIFIACVIMGCDAMYLDDHPCRLKEHLENGINSDAEKVFNKTAFRHIGSDSNSTQGYVMQYTLSNYNAEDVNIKIKDGLLYMNMEKDGLTIPLSVRRLPKNVNPYQGSWCFDNGELTITLNYKKPNPTERSATNGEHDHNLGSSWPFWKKGLRMG